MASPVHFPMASAVLQPPPGMDNCDPLPIRPMVDSAGHHLGFASAWKLTPEELATIAKTGIVWLVVCGKQHPPVIMSGHVPWIDETG